MRNGICPKCDSNEIINGLWLKDYESHPPFVEVVEPKPPNASFIWIQKNERSNFLAFVCAACGYTEFYAADHQKLRNGILKGFQRN